MRHALLLTALLLAGCGHAPLTAAPRLAADSAALNVNAPTSLRAKAARAAVEVVAAFDKDHDGMIGREETPFFARHEFDTTSHRVDDTWVDRTTVYYDVFNAVPEAAFLAADTNHDAKLALDELVEGYMVRRDTNGDSKIGIWEQVKAFFSPLGHLYVEEIRKETDRQTRREYDPVRR